MGSAGPEQHERMQHGRGQRNVSRPVVKGEQLDGAARPSADRVVPDGDEQAKKEVERKQPDGDQREVCGQFDGREHQASNTTAAAASLHHDGRHGSQAT